MSSAVKVVIACVVAVAGSDYVVKTFTGAGDSDNERMAWRFGSAAVAGYAMAKALKIGG